MKLAIIAGGKGTRLGLHDRPKPMVSIKGRPLLEHQIDLARKYGIREVFILSGHHSKVILDHFGNGRKFGIPISHVVEKRPLGTAGAVKQLADKVEERLLVFYGDIYLDVDLHKFIEFDALAPSVATIIVHPNDHPFDSDLVEMNEENVVTAFHPKPRGRHVYLRNLVNAAVYIIDPDIMSYIPVDMPMDFGRDLFPLLLREGRIIRAYNTAEYAKDLGTHDRLKRVCKDVSEGKPLLYSKRNKRPAIFLDRDGTLVRDIDLLHKIEDLELFPFSGPAVRNINESGHLCFLITNQSVVARNLCDLSDVRKIHNKLETLLAGSGAYLDDIYVCPHHPDGGYPEENPRFKISCDCRKPETGMIERAEKEFNVDRESSWLIGDTTTDLQTGKNAGMQTVLVRTGKAGKDGKFHSVPDFTFDNLDTAVAFIIETRHAYKRYIDMVLSRVKSGDGRSPHVVSVAGLARSGKSTFIKILQRALYKNGLSGKVISLDNWLIGADKRTDGMTVRERYRYSEIERNLKRFMEGETVAHEIYDPYLRTVVGEESMSLDSASYVIIDGIPALDMGYVRAISGTAVYVKVAEEVRKERFFSFYRWKGLPESEIEPLYRKRQADESPIIRKSRKHADITVEV